MSTFRTTLMPTAWRQRMAVGGGGVVLALAAVVAVAAWWGRAAAPAEVAAPASLGGRSDPYGFARADVGGMAPSLDGTQPGGQVHDGQAGLILSAELLRRFDYWLATHGERSLETIRADIAQDLADELTPDGLRRALRLRDAYIAYKTDLARLQPLPAGTYAADALAQQLQAIRAVRARHFAADEVQALFGVDDATDDHALARLRIGQDPSLSSAERRRQLARLSERLSPEQRAAETEPVLHLSVAEAVTEARARGADAREVMAIRTRMVGPEAAERLAQVDAEQARWLGRVQRYLALKQTNPEEAAAHKAAEFSPAEQLRLGAHE